MGRSIVIAFKLSPPKEARAHAVISISSRGDLAYAHDEWLLSDQKFVSLIGPNGEYRYVGQPLPTYESLAASCARKAGSQP